MSKLAAHGSRFWVDEFPLHCFLSAAEMNVMQQTADVTTFCDTGPRRVVGDTDHKGTLNGFFDTAAATDSDPLAFIDLRTDEDHYFLQSFGAAAEGGIAYERVIRLKDQVRAAKAGQAVLLNITDEGSGPIARSTILRSAAVTATGNGTGRNMGTTTTPRIFQAVFRVLAVSGAGSITLQVQESSDDGGSDAYAAISGLEATFTAIGVQRMTATATTEAWKRARVSALSGFTSVTVLVTAGALPST